MKKLAAAIIIFSSLVAGCCATNHKPRDPQKILNILVKANERMDDVLSKEGMK